MISLAQESGKNRKLTHFTCSLCCGSGEAPPATASSRPRRGTLFRRSGLLLTDGLESSRKPRPGALELVAILWIGRSEWSPADEPLRAIELAFGDHVDLRADRDEARLGRTIPGRPLLRARVCHDWTLRIR